MKIEKNTPIPASSKGRPRKYPFAEMQPGDSVFFDGEKVGSNPYVAAQMVGRKKNWKFSGRTIDGGLRIWRVE